MMNYNKAILLGRVTADPTIRNGMARFAIATNKIYTNQRGEKDEQTEFHNIVAFNKLSKVVEQFVKKSTVVMVEGSIQSRELTERDGTKKVIKEIRCDNLQFLNLDYVRNTPENESEQ